MTMKYGKTKWASPLLWEQRWSKYSVDQSRRVSWSNGTFIIQLASKNLPGLIKISQRKLFLNFSYWSIFVKCYYSKVSWWGKEKVPSIFQYLLRNWHNLMWLLLILFYIKKKTQSKCLALVVSNVMNQIMGHAWHNVMAALEKNWHHF